MEIKTHLAQRSGSRINVLCSTVFDICVLCGHYRVKTRLNAESPHSFQSFIGDQ